MFSPTFYAGITFGVGVSFLLVAIIIASTCLFLCRHAKQVSGKCLKLAIMRTVVHMVCNVLLWAAGMVAKVT